MRFSPGQLLAAVLGVCAGAACAEDAAVRLPGGSRFMLELSHHITSGRTPAGSPVFFRVASDVVAGHRTVIRKGTVVEGRMQAINERGMVGTSGSINFGVRYVPAVDGQNIRVLATVSNKGRSRDGALLGWVFMWGIFGFTTRGVDAYALRGAQLEAEVLSDRDVGADAAPPPEAAEPELASVRLVAARLGRNTVQSVVASLERASEQRTLSFDLPDGVPVASASLASVNGRAAIEPVAALSVMPRRVEFAFWDIIKYCDDGENLLQFHLSRADGTGLEGTYALDVRLERKQP
jgi:hypothetical protein